MNGPEMLMNTIFKVMGIDPVEGKANFIKVVQAVSDVKDSMDRMEGKLDTILKALGKETANGPGRYDEPVRIGAAATAASPAAPSAINGAEG